MPPGLCEPPPQAGPVRTDAAAIRRAFRSALSPGAGPCRAEDIEALEGADEGLLGVGGTLPIKAYNRINDL